MQCLTNARRGPVADMLAASKAMMPTEPSKRQFAEDRCQLCARFLRCLLAARLTGPFYSEAVVTLNFTPICMRQERAHVEYFKQLTTNTRVLPGDKNRAFRH